jgi:hypothetical protein
MTDPAGMKVRIADVTPHLALKLLEKNTRNRSVAYARVDQYANDMRRGDWQLNGEAIKIAADGQILDGQHRLMAVIEADRPVQMLLITGLEPETQETMDQGRSRSFGDVLKLRDEKSYSTLAAAVRTVCLYERDGLPYLDAFKPSPSIHQLVRTLERNPEIRDSVAFALKHKRPWVPVTAIAALHYLFSVASIEDADDFMLKLLLGENITAASPIYVLRERLIREHAETGARTINARIQLAFLIRAWNAYRHGEVIQRLLWNGGGANPDRFPQIDGLAQPTVTDTADQADAA